MLSVFNYLCYWCEVSLTPGYRRKMIFVLNNKVSIQEKQMFKLFLCAWMEVSSLKVVQSCMTKKVDVMAI